MLLSRAKAAISATETAITHDRKAAPPTLNSFLIVRDYVGALTLLEFERSLGTAKQPDNWLCTGYAAFHLGDYATAMQIYQTLCAQADADPLWHLYLGICQFYLGMYEQAQVNAQKGPTCKLQNRLSFHLAHKSNEDKKLMHHHQHLQDVVEDQLTLASVHYLRGHYQEAIDIYKRLVGEHPSYLALHVYLALCYYKLDYYDVAQEVLTLYLQKFPDSVTACNLKACNHFRLYNGKAAELELRGLLDRLSGGASGVIGTDGESMPTASISPPPGRAAATHNRQMFAQDIIRHNLIVFKNGEGALRVLPSLIDVVPEARLNMAIYHLRQNEATAAYELMKDVDPASPSEYILKAIVNAVIGQTQESREHLKLAQQNFQLVGSSASECDTIAGRQCMASCFFLLRHFEDVLVYLNSIKAYFFNDDSFNLNFAQAKAGLEQWQEAEEALLAIQSDAVKSEFTYISHLAKCFIMNKKGRQAWELYLKLDTSTESLALLQLIAHEAYRNEQYLWSAKAFDVLERLDPSTPEHWEGKRGACIGVFRNCHRGHEPEGSALVSEIVSLLLNSANPQAEYLARIMRRWIARK